MTNLIYHTISNKPLASPFDAVILRIAASGTIRVVSPYIDAAYLARIVATTTGDWRLVSDVEEWLSALSVQSRPRAWQFIRENVDRIHHCTALHAKAVIGRGMAMLGSANLTRSGILRREELGILVDDPALVAELHAWFDSLWLETSQPLADEADALIQWLDAEASEPPTTRQKFVLSLSARKVRSFLISDARSRQAISPKMLDLAMVAEAIVTQDQKHYESLAQAVTGSIDARIDRSSFTLGDVVRDTRHAFPEARAREILFLVIQRCTNHPRSVFVKSTENHLVINDGRFTKSSRGEALGAIAPFDAFLSTLIYYLDFISPRQLPPEVDIQNATGFRGHEQTTLITELLACDLLTLHDVAGELPRYALQFEFEWDGRFELFSKARTSWNAAKTSLLGIAGKVGGTGDKQPLTYQHYETRYGREGPSALDRAWDAIRTSSGSQQMHRPQEPSIDQALAQLLTALLQGQSLQRPDAAGLHATISQRTSLSGEATDRLLIGSNDFPPLVRVVIGDDGTSQRLEINPGLTWQQLAAYPKTQAVCERFLGIG